MEIVGLVCYVVIGCVAAYMFMRYEAKQRGCVDHSSVMGCFAANIMIWPAILAFVGVYYAKQKIKIEITLNPFKLLANHFNNKYGE